MPPPNQRHAALTSACCPLGVTWCQRHLTTLMFSEHADLHASVVTKWASSEKRLLHLSDELLAAVLALADAPGVMFRLLQASLAVTALRCHLFA